MEVVDRQWVPDDDRRSGVDSEGRKEKIQRKNKKGKKKGERKKM